MNKRFFVLSLRADRTQSTGLVFCAVLFICGAIAGTVSAGLIHDGTTLRHYLESYLSSFSGASASKPALFSAVVTNFKYQLLTVFFGLSVFGVVLIPLLSAARGFFLCFSVSAIVRLFGGRGVLLSLSIFGMNTLLTLPCFFIIALTAYSASLSLLKRALPGSLKPAAELVDRRMLLSCGLCFIVLFFTAVVDTYLTAHLIALTASHITS
ncbi:stage II sporulation protein M [Oscillospiraceae bacterium CM]|nr:stage II sporulation protein M [Oscillospiraceae bacterium CM]